MDTQKPFLEVAGRKNFGPAHALMTTPQPCVMIATWDKDHTPDVMMAAWAGQYDHNQIVVSMSKHKTTENIELTGAFTVSFADVRTVAESDFLGIASGTKVPDKVAKVGFTVSPSPNVDAPIIDQYPLTLECKVVSWKDGIRRGEIPFDTLPDIDGRHFDDTQDALDLLVGQVQDVAVVVVGHAGHPRFGLDEDHGRNHGHHEEPKQEDPPRQPSGEGLDGHSHASRAPIP